MNKALLYFLAGISLFSVSAFAMDEKPVDEKTTRHTSVKAKEIFSVMPETLLTTHQSIPAFLNMEWGLCSETTDYWIGEKVIKDILQRVDEYNAAYPDSIFFNTFDIRHPSYNKERAERDYRYKDSVLTVYRIYGRSKSLDKNSYQAIEKYTLFRAMLCEPSPDEPNLCSWDIQGQYPSGEKFFLGICNTNLADPERSEISESSGALPRSKPFGN